jgi:Fe-S-cluster-containing hydrogenase component 2
MQKRILTLLFAIIIICGMLYAIKSIYYQIDQSQCQQCGRCTLHCTPAAIQFNEQSGGLFINAELCTGCGECVDNCPYGAIYSVTGNSDDSIPVPTIHMSNCPNPMRSYTDFVITIPKNIKQAELCISNSKGQTVYKRVVNKTDTTFRWNGKDSHGKYFPAGVYVATLTYGKLRTINKITLVR